MDTFSAIERRRSVKYFDAQHKMTEAQIDRILSAAILSPTSFNIQNWRFVRVADVALRQEIRQVAWNQAQVTDASLLLVLCADLRAWAKEPQRYWKNAPEKMQEILVPAITKFYDGNEQAQRDEAMRSCGIAAQTLMLAAQAMGYDSCSMAGFDPAAVGRLINLPEDHIIVMLLAIGKAVEPARERGGQLPLSEVVVTDRFA